MLAGAGKSPKVSNTHIAAVYDGAGRVVRMHHVVVFEGGKRITQEEAQKEAIELERRRGRDVAKLKSLVVDRLPVGGGQFRVDVKTRKLVAVETPPRRRTPVR